MKSSAILLLLLAFAAAGSAAETTNSLQGDYKQRFKLPKTPSPWNSDPHEASLELMKKAPDELYFHVRAEFYNTHDCDLSGIAVQKSSSQFIYSHPVDGKGVCTFTINITKEKIVIADPAETCSAASCGADVILDGLYFDRSKRVSILHKNTLLNSDDYQEAVKQRANLH